MTVALTESVTRLECIAEALEDLLAIFYDPFGTCGITTATVSLESEFTGPYRDDEITGRLWKFAEAAEAGKLKVARRHLAFVERKLSQRWGIGKRGGSARAKVQVTRPSDSPASPQTPDTAHRRQEAA